MDTHELIDRAEKAEARLAELHKVASELAHDPIITPTRLVEINKFLSSTEPPALLKELQEYRDEEKAAISLSNYLKQKLGPLLRRDLHSDYELIDEAEALLKEVERLREALYRSQVEKHGASGMCCQLREQERQRAEAAEKEVERLRAELKSITEGSFGATQVMAKENAGLRDKLRIATEALKEIADSIALGDKTDLDFLVHLRSVVSLRYEEKYGHSLTHPTAAEIGVERKETKQI